MKEFSLPPTGPSCAEVRIEQHHTTSLLPAYPMLMCVTYGRLAAVQAGQNLIIESGNCALFKAGETVTLDVMSSVPSTLVYAELANINDTLLHAHRLPLLLMGIDATRTHDYLQQFLAFQAQSEKAGPYQHYEGALLANGLMLLLLKALEQQATSVQLATSVAELQKIRAYCLENLADKISISDLQKIFFTSRAPLFQLLKKVSGLSPMAYVRQIRLEHALQLLQSSQKSVQEIAAECGFPSPFHFSRTFKKYYNLSPSDYRSQAHHRSLSKGDLLMRQQRYTEAIDAYLEQLEAEHDSPAGNEIRYKLGLSFYHAEEYDDALIHWQMLRNTPYWLKAATHIIEILFRAGRFEEGVQLFRDLYTQAQEAGVHKAFHTLWLRWFRSLRQQRAGGQMEMLLQLRKDLFPAEEETADATDKYLLRTGRGGEVAPGRPLYAAGLRKAGRFQEIVDSPHCSRREKAKALLLMGRYQTIVDDYRDFELEYATALGLLGKAETGLKQFAPDSEAYAICLFYNGEYDRLLTDYRQLHRLCCHACYMKKEPERLITGKTANLWHAPPALCLLGRTREARSLILGSMWEFGKQIAVVEAIQMLLRGERTRAESALVAVVEAVRSDPAIWLRAPPAYLVLEHLRKDESNLTELGEMVRNRYYEDQQGSLWFQARLLVGAIDDEAYLAQPRQHPNPHMSLPLFQAIRDDLAGNVKRSIKNYRVVFDRYSQNMLYFEEYPSWHWYIKWRLHELGAMPE